MSSQGKKLSKLEYMKAYQEDPDSVVPLDPTQDNFYLSEGNYNFKTYGFSFSYIMDRPPLNPDNDPNCKCEWWYKEFKPPPGEFYSGWCKVHGFLG